MLTSAFIRIVYLAIMFLAGLVLSNLALPERFGTISLIVLNASFISLVTGLGTDSMILHKVSKKEWTFTKAAQFTRWAIAVQLFLFFLLELGSLFIWHKTLLSGEKPGFLLIDAVYFLGLLLTEKYLALLYSFQRARLANVLLVMVAGFYLLLFLLIPNNKAYDFSLLLGLFAGQSFVQGFLLLVVFHLHNKPTTRKEPFHLSEFVQVLKLSSVVMVTNVIQLLAYRLDFWIIKFFFNNYDVGIYAQANKFANLVWLVPNILAQLLIPKFSQLPRNDVPKVFSMAFYTNFLNIAATVGCTIVFYFFYLKPAYKAGLFSFYMMLPGYFFWATVLYFSAYFSWQGRFVYNFFCSSCCFVIIFFSDILLIPRYGINGAAMSNTIAYTTVFLLYLFILKSRYSYKWKELLLPPKNDFLKIAKFLTG